MSVFTMKFVWMGLDNHYLLRLLNYCFRRDSSYHTSFIWRYSTELQSI